VPTFISVTVSKKMSDHVMGIDMGNKCH